MGTEDRTVVQLLAELQVDVPFGVETGKIVTDTDTDSQVSTELPSAPLPKQGYFAQSGAVQLRITRQQMEALRRTGAPGKDVEVMRSFKNDQNIAFSVKCPGCQRWIHLGRIDHPGQCFCGQNYRVVFDMTPEDWSLRQEMRCMDCGVERTLSSLSNSSPNPWHMINEHQMQCAACVQKRLADQASERLNSVSQQRG